MREEIAYILDVRLRPRFGNLPKRKDCFGLDQCQAGLYAAILRHTVLVMAALAICAVTAAQLRDRTDTQAPAPVMPDQAPPLDPGKSRSPSPRSSACSPAAWPGHARQATSTTG